MTTQYVEKSANRKLGPMPVLSRTFDTCPPACAFYDHGCYAVGRMEAWVRQRGHDDWVDALERLAEAPRGAVCRVHTVGDVMRTRQDGTVEVDLEYVAALNDIFTRRRPDLQPIMFTHAWSYVDADLFEFPVNASCESLADVREATARGYLPTLVIASDADPLLGAQVDGRRVVRCPEQTRPDDVTCRSCKLCAKDYRARPIVTFVVHGAGFVRAANTVRDRQAGRWGGRSLPWLDAAVYVLDGAPGPMKVRSIVSEIRRLGLRDLSKVRTPHQTLARDLRQAVHGGDLRFVRVGPGTYASSGLAAALQDEAAA